MLDLGCRAGGFDVLLSARRVGPRGRVYGMDMTDEMLELAERNRRVPDADSVEFLRGRIEDIPLADGSVEVALSNCVINLSPDKERVFAEGVPGASATGRLAITDIAVLEPLPETIRATLERSNGSLRIGGA
ncbi:MAG: methyltransferase domain-containing protein [Thermoleophilaceae bacterium]